MGLNLPRLLAHPMENAASVRRLCPVAWNTEGLESCPACEDGYALSTDEETCEQIGCRLNTECPSPDANGSAVCTDRACSIGISAIFGYRQ